MWLCHYGYKHRISKLKATINETNSKYFKGFFLRFVISFKSTECPPHRQTTKH